MWTAVGAGSRQSALVLALRRGAASTKEVPRGRGAARLGWGDGLRTGSTVSGWVDWLEAGK